VDVLAKGCVIVGAMFHPYRNQQFVEVLSALPVLIQCDFNNEITGVHNEIRH
jgi:hypothetical protein